MRYSADSMDIERFSAGTTVAEALDGKAGTSAVFIRHDTACVGCYLARFCTLLDVADIYGLSLKELLGELSLGVDADNSSLIGAQYAKPH